MNKLLILGCVLGVGLSPSMVSAQQGQWVVVAPPSAPMAQQPVEPVTTSRPIIGLAVSGGVLLGVSWLLHSLLVSPLAGCDLDTCEQAWTDFRYAGLIPLAGPFVQMAVRPTSDRDLWGPYLVVDGVLQLAGLTMLILGLSIRETTTTTADAGTGLDLVVGPSVLPGGGGLMARGRF